MDRGQEPLHVSWWSKLSKVAVLPFPCDVRRPPAPVVFIPLGTP
jgi:hypothetical protein